MSYNLLIISSMYPGYLRKFYSTFPGIAEGTYSEHYDRLISDSTEFVASYTRNFCKLGINANAIIANDKLLQKKWCKLNNVRRTDKENLLENQIVKYKPDILWIEDLRFLNTLTLNNIRKLVPGIKLLIAYHCAPWNLSLLDKLKCFDFVITCTPGLQEQLVSEGINSYQVYHGFDKDILPKLKPDLNEEAENKVIFCGSLFTGEGYHNDRIKLLNHLLKKSINISLYINLESRYRILAKKILYSFNLVLRKLSILKKTKTKGILEYGLFPVNFFPKNIIRAIQKPEYGVEMYQLLKSSSVVLNNHGDVAGNYAGNMRLFEVTGVGSCLLTDNKTNLKDLFEPDKEIVVYNDPEDCAEKIKWLCENEKVRMKIAIAGQKKTLVSHTVEDRCKRIISIIDIELKKRGY